MSGNRDSESPKGSEVPSPDSVHLSAYERHVLAELESRARLQDPALAIRLRRAVWQHVAGRLGRWPGPARTGRWFGPTALVAGLVLVVVALSVSAAVAVPGVGLLVAGGYRLGIGVRARLQPAGDGSHPASPRAPAGG
jgi:hypothetical protein